MSLLNDDSLQHLARHGTEHFFEDSPMVQQKHEDKHFLKRIKDNVTDWIIDRVSMSVKHGLNCLLRLESDDL